MGLVRYYQRFVPRLAELSQPLTKLLRKEANPTQWGPEQDQAVLNIKTAFLEPPVLAHFDPALPTILHTDASDFAVGAVLSQDHDGVERPVCYASKTLDRAQANYTVTEKECLAVVWATELFRTLLLGKPFTLETDHSALRQILTTKDSAGRLARWALKLQEYDMNVLYRKGVNQGNADFFSRIVDLGDGTHAVNLVVDEQEWLDQSFQLDLLTPLPRPRARAGATVLRLNEAIKSAIFPVVAPDPDPPEDPYEHYNQPPVSLAELLHHQETDPLCQALNHHEQTGLLPPEAPAGELTWAATWIQENALSLIKVHGVWYRISEHTLGKGGGVRHVTSVLVPPSLRQRVMRSAHCHQVLGHRGVVPTYRILRESFWWKSMATDVANFVHHCPICQDKYRPPTQVPALQRPLPSRPWQVASMDFAGPFGPLSNSINKYVLVYVDNFSRYTYLSPAGTTMPATALRILKEHIFPLTGRPETLIFDWAGAFVSKQFEDALASLNITPDKVAPDNHRANGLAERMVRVLNDIMRHLSEADKARWPSYLKELQQSIATTPSADTGISPMNFGLAIPRPGLTCMPLAYARTPIGPRGTSDDDPTPTHIGTRPRGKSDRETKKALSF
jgi:transposase InsO family protein